MNNQLDPLIATSKRETAPDFQSGAAGGYQEGQINSSSAIQGGTLSNFQTPSLSGPVERSLKELRAYLGKEATLQPTPISIEGLNLTSGVTSETDTTSGAEQLDKPALLAKATGEKSSQK